MASALSIVRTRVLSGSGAGASRSPVCNRHAIAMDENVASAGTYPSEAVHRHLGIGNDLFGRLDDQRAELAACAILDQKDEANRRARHKIDLGGNWFIAIRTAVRVSSGNPITIDAIGPDGQPQKWGYTSTGFGVNHSAKRGVSSRRFAQSRF
jgi:hypothetical protein